MSKALTEGKTKVVHDTGNGEVLIVSKDDITAGDGAKHDTLEGKAACATRTTCNVFELLEANGIRTHYVGREDDITFRARNVRMIPLELVVRRIATGSYVNRNPSVPDGTVLEDLVFEIFEKDDASGDPLLLFLFKDDLLRRYKPKEPNSLISEERIAGSRYADVTNELLNKLKSITIRVFSILEEAWAKQGGVLFDFKIECGFDQATSRLLVADVIDNDSWRLRFGGVQKDKQNYRDGSKSLPDIKKDYAEVAATTDSFV